MLKDINVYPSPGAPSCKLLHVDTPMWREFFIIAFIFVLDKANVMYNMSWFMEGGLLCPRPWQTGFNLFTQFLSLGIIWVQMSRLPPGYWNANSLKAIRNVLVDLLSWPQRQLTCQILPLPKYFYLDLRKGLAEKFIIYYNHCSWTEMLDYEHIAF